MENSPRQIIPTTDGSHTIRIPAIKATYHSLHGAVQESLHVFLRAGLLALPSLPLPLRILEMGLGTGLNAFLTWIQAEERAQRIEYTAVEQFPLTSEEVAGLNYPELLGHEEKFRRLHASPWEERVALSEEFSLCKRASELTAFLQESSEPCFHLVYYDAFAPSAQPELWTAEVFALLHRRMEPGGILVTYCSKTVVRRALEAAGFRVERPAGPHGKREMVRAQALGRG